MGSSATPPEPRCAASRCGGRVATWLLIPAIALSATGARAGDWEITPRVDLRQIYSDNVDLLPSPPGARHNWVTEVAPGIDIQGSGRRVEASIFYSAQALYYARDDDSELNHRLQADVTTEVLEELLFVDVNANVRQENISSRGRVSGDNINRTGNRQDVFTVNVSPYLRRRFGSYAEATLRYRMGAVINERTSGRGRDSDLMELQLDVNSGSYFQRLSWDILARYREEQPEGSFESDRKFTRIRGDARYRINRKWAALVGLGYEDDDFDGSRLRDEPTWLLGGAYNPHARLSLEGGVEDRSFGTAPFVQMRYRKRRVLATANYTEEVTSSNQQRAERRDVSTTDAFGRPIDPDTGALLDNRTDVADSDNEVFVRRRFDGTLTYEGRRNTVTVRGFHSTRDYEVSRTEETDYGVVGSLTHRFNGLLSGRVFGSWQETDFRDGDRRERWDIGGSITRSLSRTLSVTGEIRHLEQDGDNPLDDYHENRASIQISKTF